ncbi:MAG: tyrosine-protein phosphatase [Solirubrobacterales bacterium]
MIDLHIHLLPGIDDGPATIDESLLLARAEADEGVTALTVTPHVTENHPTTPQQMFTGLSELRAAVAAAGIELEVRGGAEIALDRIERLSDQDLRDFTLAGNQRYVLVECPYAAWPMELELHIGRLAQLGIRPLLAHPERSAGVQSDEGLERLELAVDRGLLVQITAGSLSGRHGDTPKRTARTLVERELVHVIASDAHSHDQRPPRLAEAAEAVGDEALAQWLTVGAPGAIFAGAAIPDRPERQKRRSLFRRR